LARADFFPALKRSGKRLLSGWITALCF